jgi:hypothetical protein
MLRDLMGEPCKRGEPQGKGEPQAKINSKTSPQVIRSQQEFRHTDKIVPTEAKGNIPPPIRQPTTICTPLMLTSKH